MYETIWWCSKCGYYGNKEGTNYKIIKDWEKVKLERREE